MPPETWRGPWRSRPGAVLHAAVSFWARGRPWAGTYQHHTSALCTISTVLLTRIAACLRAGHTY